MTEPVVAGDVVARVSQFVELLRAEGFLVGPGETIGALEALEALGIADPDGRYWALRLALVRAPAQIPVFDRVFAAFWRGDDDAQPQELRRRGPRDDAALPDGEPAASASAAPAPTDGDDAADDEPDGASLATYNALEVLRSMDFRDYDEDDYRALSSLLERVRLAGPWRPARRDRAAPRGRFDPIETMRRGFRTGGHPVRPAYRVRELRQRKLVLVCDVSGSMAAYARALLHLGHALILQRANVEAFAFASRLTRMTPELVERDPARAIEAAAGRVVDWSGGTRIGHCLAELHREHHARLRGSVLLIASDGWDLGDPLDIDHALARLRRVARSVLWLNPHLRDPAFEPLTRGMVAALPHVDELVACHDFRSFEGLVDALARL